MVDETPGIEYVGFWSRTLASLIDTVLSGVVLSPIISALGRDTTPLPVDLSSASIETLGRTLLASMQPKDAVDAMVSWGLPALAILAFWIARQATPGKMVVHARIVDATTRGKPSTGQLIGRYLAYYVSLFPLGLGFFWVAVDPRKQGWHDKIANTLVVRSGTRDAPSANDQGPRQ